LILRKIIEIAGIRCHILKLKCTKFDFDWGSVPDPNGGAYSNPQAPYLVKEKGRGRLAALAVGEMDAPDHDRRKVSEKLMLQNYHKTFTP